MDAKVKEGMILDKKARDALDARGVLIAEDGRSPTEIAIHLGLISLNEDMPAEASAEV